MRVVLADLKGADGFVHKDTAAQRRAEHHHGLPGREDVLDGDVALILSSLVDHRRSLRIGSTRTTSNCERTAEPVLRLVSTALMN